MSRSRRKTLIFPVTCAKSDKEFKTKEHKRERRLFKIKLVNKDFEITDVPGHKTFGNPWASQKDGKFPWPDAPKKRISK